MDDPVRRLIEESMNTPLGKLMRAMLESGRHKLLEQLDLSWQGVSYMVFPDF